MEVNEENIRYAENTPLVMKVNELVLDTRIYGDPCGRYSDNCKEGSDFWTELVHTLGDEVQTLKNFLEEQEEEGNIELPVDVYRLGDVANFLQAIEIKITGVER